MLYLIWKSSRTLLRTNRVGREIVYLVADVKKYDFSKILELGPYPQILIQLVWDEAQAYFVKAPQIILIYGHSWKPLTHIIQELEMKPEVALSEALWKPREEWPLGSDCRDPQPGLGREPGECLFLILLLELSHERHSAKQSNPSLSLQILMDHITKDQSTWITQLEKKHFLR